MFPGLIARPLRALLALVAIVAVGAGLWLWDRAGSSTPVDARDALSSFHRAGGTAAPGRPGVPAAGVYRYRQSGSERGGIGPLRLSRRLPGTALYVVTHEPGGYREQLDISAEHVEGLAVRVGPRGTREVSRRTDVTFLGLGRDDRRALVPPPLRLPRPLRVGAAWSGRYAAGPLPVSARGRVLRADVVEVGGRRLPVRVVRTVTDTGGAHPGRRTDELWWSPALSLPLRWTIDMEIRGIVSLRARADLTLETTAPLT